MFLRYFAAVSAALVLASPAHAGPITFTGDVTPDPTSGTVAGALAIGKTSTGQVVVDEGASLSSGQLWLGTTATGNGSLVVLNAGSRVGVGHALGGNLDIGMLGYGQVRVEQGGGFAYGDSSAACQLNCRVFVSNGAGSRGYLGVLGAGSRFDTVGGVVVGNASVFTLATDGFNFGTPGGASEGLARAKDGGVINSSFLSIAQPGGGLGRTGAETSTATVAVSGTNSAWNIVRNAAQTGARALLSMATGANTTAALGIVSGGVMRLDGSAAPSELSGVNMGTGIGVSGANAIATMSVLGVGSRLEVNGGTGFFNVGRGAGTVADVTVSDGGVITGSGATPANGLSFVSVGRNGGTGTLTVDGAGSLFRMSGQDVFSAGAFLHVGRAEDGLAGHGTVNVVNGGRFEIDTSALVLTNPASQSGMIVGRGAGSTGVLNISGAGSEVVISNSSGLTPFVAIGRDGASGTLTVSGGGRLEVSSTHVSALSSTSLYAPGEANILNIGRRFTGADGLTSRGTVTVTGSGSQIVMSGTADRLVNVGRDDNSVGTLNLLNGGALRSTTMLLGDGATANGTLNMNAGLLVLDGRREGGPNPGGAGLSVGRNGGTGSATIANGSSVTITTDVPGGGIGVGGSQFAPGGFGTMLISGGSTVSVNGTDGVTVGRGAAAAAPGIGTLALSGAGSSLTTTGGSAVVLIAANANSFGTLSVGAGTSLTSSNLIGVAHDGAASTLGAGSLIVNGTATAVDLIIGSTGALGGSGVVNASVTNFGTITPGTSPGRLTINGTLHSGAGRIVLEVQSLGSGLYAYDELVFGDPSAVDLGAVGIEFDFLGDTDPNAFLASGLFDIDNFLKSHLAGGGFGELDHSMFDSAHFSASADAYHFEDFSFSADGGARFSATHVPEPESWLLLLAGLGSLAFVRRRFVGRLQA